MDLKRCKELNAAGLPVALAPDQMIALIEEVERLRIEAKEREALALGAFVAGYELCQSAQPFPALAHHNVMGFAEKYAKGGSSNKAVEKTDLTQPGTGPCRNWDSGFCYAAPSLNPNAVNGACLNPSACSAKDVY